MEEWDIVSTKTYCEEGVRDIHTHVDGVADYGKVAEVAPSEE